MHAHLTAKGRRDVEALRQRARERGYPWPIPEALLSEFVDLIPNEAKPLVLATAAREGMKVEHVQLAVLRMLCALAQQDERLD